MENFPAAIACCKCESMTTGPYRGVETRNQVTVESLKKSIYQEISTEMIGNALIIRVEKDPKKRLRKMRDNWDPPCDCDMIEIRRPTNGDSAKIVNGGDGNQIKFKVYSQTGIPKDDVKYKPQVIAYKVGSCRGGAESNDQCRTVTVYPQMGGPGSQEVHSDHITEGNQDVYLLRIKKRPDTMDPKLRNIELELRTPRPPTPESKDEIKLENPTSTSADREDALRKETVKEKKGKEVKEKGKKKKKMKK